MGKRSPFRKGREGVSKSSSVGGRFISGMKDGDSIVFAPLTGLDGMISADMHEYWDVRPAIYHPCIGRNCPGCAMGHEPRFKGYMAVYTREGETKVLPFTITTYNKFEMLEDEMDDETLAGKVIKYKRTGTGYDTTYTPMPIGKELDISEVEVPDFVDWLGPATEEGIRELLEENGFDPPGSDESGEADADEELDVSEESEDSPWGDV